MLIDCTPNSNMNSFLHFKCISVVRKSLYSDVILTVRHIQKETKKLLLPYCPKLGKIEL